MKKISKILLSVLVLFTTGKALAQSQAAKDEKILTEYFAKNHIKATKAPSGLYYTIHKQGSGPNAKNGQSVSMLYLGKFLDGQQFDANMDADYKQTRNPFTFTLGAGQVISGWDAGIALLNKGSRASLYLPSASAYGPAGAGGRIPPNTVLIFDVEVVDIK